jgi:hypothetical protein
VSVRPIPVLLTGKKISGSYERQFPCSTQSSLSWYRRFTDASDPWSVVPAVVLRQV